MSKTNRIITAQTIYYIHERCFVGNKDRDTRVFSATYSLDISGSISANHNISASGNLTVVGDATIEENLLVLQNTTIEGDASIAGTVYARSVVEANYILVPAGCIMQYGGSTAPGGWLLCDGGQYDASNYNALFNAIGYTYGGSFIFFNVPDFRGRTIVGASNLHILGDSSGEETHRLTIDEMPSHNHSLHGVNTFSTVAVIDYDQAYTTTGGNNSTGYTGGGGVHNNMQPYLVVNYIIKI